MTFHLQLVCRGNGLSRSLGMHVCHFVAVVAISVDSTLAYDGNLMSEATSLKIQPAKSLKIQPYLHLS